MEWLFYAFLALFGFALSSILDGLAIKKFIGDAKRYLFYSTFIQGLFGAIAIFILFKTSFYKGPFLLICFITGLFYVYGLLPYMRALEFEEVSRISPLFNLEPIFVLIASIILLNLQLIGTQYIGIILLILGSFLISTKIEKRIFKLSKGFWYMILTNLILTGFFIGTEYLFKNYDYWSAFAYIQLGILFASLTLIFFKNYGREGIVKLKTINLYGKIIILSVGFISIVAVGLRNMAIKLSHAALISSLAGFESIIVFGLVLLISIRHPSFLNEEINKKIIIQKVTAIILLIIGIYFIYI
jgi:uncharacterized membrane protein